MEKEMLKLDINSADREEILKLPGVGPQLADQIVEGRPYMSLDDLRRVKGIGPVILERLEQQLSIAYPAEDSYEVSALADETAISPSGEVRSDLVEDSAEETESEMEFNRSPTVLLTHGESSEDTNGQDAVEPPLQEAVQKQLEEIPSPREASRPSIKKSKDPNSRGEVWLIAAISATLTFILALAASMGVIAGINGGLRFVRPIEIVQVSQSVMGLDARIETLLQDIDGLNSRLDNLEALSGRIRAVEKEAMSLRVEMDEAASQVETIDSQVDNLAERLKTMELQSNLFQSFLDGLHDL